MSSWPLLVLALVGGAGIGVFYFGGLWLTVRQLQTSQRPALLLLGSFVGRTVLGVFAIYLASGGEVLRLLACLAGLLVARTVMLRRLGAGLPS